MDFSGADLWAAALVFARMSAMIMLLPGLGEPAAPPQARLTLALFLTLVLTPALAADFTAPPSAVSAGLLLVIQETTIGLMIGAGARILHAALATAGQVMGLETGLAFAQITDPTMTEAGQALGVFLGLLGAVLIFATELHHEFLRAAVASYALFGPGAAPDLGEAADYGVTLTGESFRIGVQIVAPLILAGLVFRAGLGVLSRLIPQIQVFFVAMPLNVLGGFAIVALGLSAGMLVWLDRLLVFAQTLN